MSRKHLATAAKAAFIVAIFTVLIQQDLLSFAAIETAISRWPWVLTGWACMGCTTLIAIFRWHFLVRAQGLPVPLRRTLQSAFVGLFFNVFLPGSLSGDVVKGYYIIRSAPGHTAATVSSILFDRIVGMSGLVTLAALALLFSSGEHWTEMLGAPIVLPVIGVTIGISVFYAALLGVREQRDPILRTLRWFAVRVRMLAGPLRVYEGIRVYHQRRRITLACLAVSVVAQFFLVTAWICFVKAIGIEGIPAVALFVVVPIGMFVATIPIGPAGIGTGHAAFLAVFALLGSDRGADLFNLGLAFQFLQAGFGGLVYLSARANDPVSREQMRAAMADPDHA